MLSLIAFAALAQEPAAPAPPAFRPPPPAATLPAVSEAGTERSTGFRVTVVPGIGIDASPTAHVDGFSVGLVGQAASLDGFDGQLGLSMVKGEARGFQGALGMAMADSVDGIQVSCGVSLSRGDVDMVQASSGVNLAGGTVRGVQVAGGVNVAQTVEGVQAAPLNVAQAVDGVQAGLLNVGGDAKGLQIGLVNVARTSEVSIAPVNLIGDGLHRVDVWTSDSAVMSGAVKFGSKQVYTLLGTGWVGVDQPWWTFGGGLGLHLQKGPLWVEVDDSVWGLASGKLLAPGVHNKLRMQVGVDLVGRHLAPFVGVSVNTWVGTGAIWPRAVDLPQRISRDRTVATWPGVHAGVSF